MATSIAWNNGIECYGDLECAIPVYGAREAPRIISLFCSDGTVLSFVRSLRPDSHIAMHRAAILRTGPLFRDVQFGDRHVIPYTDIVRFDEGLTWVYVCGGELSGVPDPSNYLSTIGDQ